MAKISRFALLLALVALPGASHAQAERLFAAYEIEWQGLTIGAFETELVNEAEAYRVTYRARTTGFLAWLWPFSSEGSSEGSFAASAPLPHFYQVTSRRRDEEESWAVRFAADGRAVHVDVPIEDLVDREPVPADMRIAPDPLALALAAIVEAGPGANLTGTSYDGKRALRLEGACAENLVALADTPPGSAAAAQREALACLVDGELTAGASRRWGGRTMRDDDRQPVAVWLGRGIREDGFWPVRVEAPTRYGTVTVRLVSLEPAGRDAPQLAFGLRSLFAVDTAQALRFNRRIGEEAMTASSRRVAIVTGAGRGIGRAIAVRLAESFDLAITDVEPEGAATANALQALFVQGDIADLAGHAPTLDRILERFGRIDCLVNNAGIASPVRGDLLELTPENYDRVLAVNLRGTLFFTQAVARRMLAQPADGARSIITVSSINAAMAAVERGDYAISKTGLAMLTKLFALRLADAGIGVFEVRPGIIRTDMTAKVGARYDEMIGRGLVPMRRWGEPEDVAGVVAALADDAFAFATGSVIEVGGGLGIPRL